MNDAGVIDPDVEKSMEFETVNVSPGDLVLFDSYFLIVLEPMHLLRSGDALPISPSTSSVMVVTVTNPTTRPRRTQ